MVDKDVVPKSMSALVFAESGKGGGWACVGAWGRRGWQGDRGKGEWRERVTGRSQGERRTEPSKMKNCSILCSVVDLYLNWGKFQDVDPNVM